MRLGRNIIWNVAGTSLPVLVGIAVVPTIVRGLGTERFGMLSIVAMLIGYFGVFDLGLGRTLTKLVADRLALDREEEIGSLTSTASTLVTVSSIVAGCGIAVSATWLAQHVLGSSTALLPEASVAIFCLAVSLPFVMLTTILTGLLEAYQEFALINSARLPLSILTLVAPLAVLPFSTNLGVVTAVLAGLRVGGTGVFVALALRRVPPLRRRVFAFRRELVRPLVSFGGWLTVSNVVGPVMVYFDRFVIAIIMGNVAVAYYTVPYDALNRVLLLPTAIQGVLFPAFAILRTQSSSRAVSIFGRSSETTMLLMMPPLLAVMLFAYTGLNLWVGSEFARNSTETAKILMIGIAVNAMARTPLVFVQGCGHAKWTGLLHSAELPFYAIALWLLLRAGCGIKGVAYAWTGRVVVDAVALYAMTARLEPRLLWTAVRDLLWIGCGCLAAVWLNWVLRGDGLRIAAVLILSLACGIVLLGLLHDYRPALLRRNT